MLLVTDLSLLQQGDWTFNPLLPKGEPQEPPLFVTKDIFWNISDKYR